MSGPIRRVRERALREAYQRAKRIARHVTVHGVCSLRLVQGQARYSARGPICRFRYGGRTRFGRLLPLAIRLDLHVRRAFRLAMRRLRVTSRPRSRQVELVGKPRATVRRLPLLHHRGRQRAREQPQHVRRVAQLLPLPRVPILADFDAPRARIALLTDGVVHRVDERRRLAALGRAVRKCDRQDQRSHLAGDRLRLGLSPREARGLIPHRAKEAVKDRRLRRTWF
mmetsp:Transcript_24856/g.56908  ORF Transcript_24856/g.56908 Transcript_24856/m.56908 type:complete len:226 (-) Transcript_24856:381-1058(-)